MPKRFALAIPLGALLLLALVAPVSAFDLTNCTLQLTSTDAQGNVIGTAAGPGQGGTQDDPLLVKWDGFVSYVGSSGSLVLMDQSYHVEVFGIPTPIRGSSPNGEGVTSAEGTVSVKDNMPIKVSGLFYVSGEISGNDGSCAGNAWLKMDEDPLTTIPFWVSIGITLIGAVVLWFSQPTMRAA